MHTSTGYVQSYPHPAPPVCSTNLSSQPTPAAVDHSKIDLISLSQSLRSFHGLDMPFSLAGAAALVPSSPSSQFPDGAIVPCHHPMGTLPFFIIIQPCLAPRASIP